MVTYVWETDDNRFVYLNGKSAYTQTAEDIAAAREYAAKFVNNESSYSIVFNEYVNSKYFNNNLDYSDYFSLDDACMYGICSVCTTLHKTEDNVARVESTLCGENTKVLYIDFYNLEGANGVNAVQVDNQYIHIVYGSINDSGYVINDDGEYIGITYNNYQEGSDEWNSRSGDTTQYKWTRIRGIDGTQTSVVQWSDLSDEEKEALMLLLKGERGEDGQDNSESNMAFKSIVFKRALFCEDEVVGGTFDNPIPEGWSDGIPEPTSENALYPVWMTTRVFSTNGLPPQTDSWTTPSVISDSEYMDYEFSVLETKPAGPFKSSPSDESSEGWSNTPSEDTVWMAMRKINNGQYVGDWSVTRIKGERGDNGTPLNIIGTLESTDELTNIVDGKSGDAYIVDGNLYIYNPSGGEFGDWSYLCKFTGSNGYMHVKYADATISFNDSEITNGTCAMVENIGLYLRFTENSGETSGRYIGIMTDNIENDTLIVSAYTWSRVEGKDGYGREYIYKSTETNEAPDIPTSLNNISDWTRFQEFDFVPDGWEDDPISVSETDRYVWVCNRISVDGEWSEFRGDPYNDGKAALWNNFALNGNNGEDGVGILDIFDYYYATSSSAETPTSATTGWRTNSIPENYNTTNCYLWNYEVTVFTNSTSAITTPSLISTMGYGIKEVKEYYLVWSAGTACPAVGDFTYWGTSSVHKQFTDDKPYLWNYEEIVYDNENVPSHIIEPACIGYKAKDGANGTSIEIVGKYDTIEDFWGIRLGSGGTINGAKNEIYVTDGSSLNTISPLSAYTGGKRSDAYMIGTNLWIWDGDSWNDVGRIKGDDGVSYYTYTKYARYYEGDDSETITVSGLGDVSVKVVVPDGTEKIDYFGICVTQTSPAPTELDAYVWVEFRGKDGNGYEFIYTLTDSEDKKPSIPFVTDDMTQSTTPGYTWNASDFQTDDFVPSATSDSDFSVIWVDERPSVTSANTCCWSCMRTKTNGVWSAFNGDSTTGKASLVYKYGMDGTDGIDGVDGADGRDGRDGTDVEYIYYRSNINYALAIDSVESEYSNLIRDLYN